MRASALVVGIAFLFVGCNRWSDKGIAESKRRGEIVCKALDAYRAKTGRYPDALQKLKPEFLQEIPAPTVADREWDYAAIDGATNYWLFVSDSEWGPTLESLRDCHWIYTPRTDR